MDCGFKAEKKKINFGLILGANKKNLIKGAFKQNSSL